MMNMHLLNRSGLAAIAAATAFLTTPALAQDAAPVVAEPAPIVADTPLPSEPANSPAVDSDTLAPAPTVAEPTRTPKAAKPVARTVRATTAPAAPRAAPGATAPAAAPVAAAATPAVDAPADPAMVAPLPEPVAAAPVAPVDTPASNNMLPIAGAAGLGLLALAGAAFAIRRRRRDEDEMIAEESWIEPETVATAPIVAAPAPVASAPIVAAPAPVATAPIVAAPISAFAWGDKPAAAARTAAPAHTPAPATTDWIEAAKRGPTPENPSASLKKRLARAAFFDRREKLVAAGKADPVDAMAGLPDALEVEPLDQPQPRSAPSVSTGFERRFQPV